MSKKTNRIKKRNRTVKRRRTVKRNISRTVKRKINKRTRRTVKKLSNKGVVPLFTVPEKMYSQSIMVNQYKQSGNMIPGLRNM